MNKNELNICRLCLKKIDTEKIEVLENFQTKMLNVVIGVDMSTCINQTVCCECSHILQKCFDFKMICLNTEDYLKTFSNINEPMKIDLEDIFFKQLSTDSRADEKQKICRLCLNWGSGYYANIGDEFDGRPLRDMLFNCLPELNLDLTNGPLVCSSCVALLKDHLVFILDFTELQNKIKMYQDHQCKDAHTDTVDLYSVLQFCQKLKVEDDIDIGSVKLENLTFSIHENTCLKVEPEGDINDDYLDVNCKVEVKDENMSENEENSRQQQKLSISSQDKTEEHNVFEQVNCLRCSYTTSCISMKNQMILHKDLQERQDNNCNYKTKLNIYQNIFNHKNCRHLQMHKCTYCSYKTNWKNNLRKHMIIHKDLSELQMYSCTNCSYETKNKYRLKEHSIVHKDPNELHMYKCMTCSYETKKKYSLVQHVINKHKDPNELQMYKCANCSYEAKQKSNLVKHVTNKHKSVSVLQMYKCINCSYETREKYRLIRHTIVHKDSSEVQMYKCTNCSFETKSKYRFKDHLTVHKDPSEVQLYKCIDCSYETKNKYCLKEHLIVHKNSSEVHMYKCTDCSYETKYKYALKRHLLVHTDPSVVQMHKCTICSHETKHKYRLKEHLLMHKDSNEVQMYKCIICSYETKHKYRLKEHLLIHKDPSEVLMYKCINCSYETKHKNCLKRHLLVHKDPSEVQMHNCTNCSYKTKSKYRFKKHLTVHKDPSEVHI